MTRRTLTLILAGSAILLLFVLQVRTSKPIHATFLGFTNNNNGQVFSMFDMPGEISISNNPWLEWRHRYRVSFQFTRSNLINTGPFSTGQLPLDVKQAEVNLPCFRFYFKGHHQVWVPSPTNGMQGRFQIRERN